MPYRRYFQRAGADALAALQAVGMEVARLLASAVVGRELHGADAGAVLALRLAGRRHMDVGEGLFPFSPKKRAAIARHRAASANRQPARAYLCTELNK